MLLGWNTVTLVNPIFIQPGLYMVSVNVVSSVSVSPITSYTDNSGMFHQGVAPPATPSVLTLVAWSVTNNPNNPFPNAVYYDSTHPTAYFWLDVSFTPMY